MHGVNDFEKRKLQKVCICCVDRSNSVLIGNYSGMKIMDHICGDSIMPGDQLREITSMILCLRKNGKVGSLNEIVQKAPRLLNAQRFLENSRVCGHSQKLINNIPRNDPGFSLPDPFF